MEAGVAVCFSLYENTREPGLACNSTCRKLSYGLDALAGDGDGLVEVELAVARPGLFRAVTTSLVKSSLSGEYITTGTPLMLMPDLSKTKSRFFALTFSITTSVISLTMLSRIRIA